MNARQLLQVAMDRKGWSAARLARECGFQSNYIHGLLREDQGGPETAETWRMMIIAEKLECPELLSLIGPWQTVPHHESAFKNFGQPSSSAKRWITFTRCVAGYMFCGEFLHWFNDSKLGQQGLGWSPQAVDGFRFARRPRNNEVFDRHVKGGFEHFVIMRESLLQTLPKGHGKRWLQETIQMLTHDLADTTRIVLVEPNKWDQLNKLLTAKTGLKYPCTVEVVDDSFAMYVEQCGGDKKASDKFVVVAPMAAVLNHLLSEVCTDQKVMIQRLKDIAQSK